MSRAAFPPEDPTPPRGSPWPARWTAPSSGGAAGSRERWADRWAAHPRAGSYDEDTARPRRPRLRAVPDLRRGGDQRGWGQHPRTGAFGQPIGRHRPSALRRLVELARVLTGGLMVLALVVVVAPVVLDARGPGVGVIAGHVAAAVIALVGTGIAAARRTPTLPATVAACVAPVTVVVVLAVFWWA